MHAASEPPAKRKSVFLYRGASYVGGELIRLLLGHPYISLEVVTSRTYAGQPVWRAHPALRGQTDLAFASEEDVDPSGADAVFIAGGHGESLQLVEELLFTEGFGGAVVDLSADFRFDREQDYAAQHQRSHPRPDLLHAFAYGLADVCAPYDTRWIANPGCFATGLALALYPLIQISPDLHASVTALTGASGSGTRPKPGTHYPTRDGNVRAYKVFEHQHLPEIRQVIGKRARVGFVPVSGPWTRGIWGTAHVSFPEAVTIEEVDHVYEALYGDEALVRCSPGQLPELRAVVGTPFCDLGWKMADGRLVVGFSLDNLLKGAASQAVQNLNLVLNLPKTAGLVPGSVFGISEEPTP